MDYRHLDELPVARGTEPDDVMEQIAEWATELRREVALHWAERARGTDELRRSPFAEEWGRLRAEGEGPKTAPTTRASRHATTERASPARGSDKNYQPSSR